MTFHVEIFRAESRVNQSCRFECRVTDPVYYSKRLLNPFRGIIQILETEKARAVSNDGINWRIQIQSQILKTPWHELEIPANYDRYFVYGVWSRKGDLVRVPIHPTLYQEHVEQSARDLIHTLLKYHDQTPFPQRDIYEYWLLDTKELKPLVLVDSSVDDNLPEFAHSMHWYPCENNDNSFTTSAFLERQETTTLKIHAKELLSDVVRNLTGSPSVAIWVKRDEVGQGRLITHNQKSKTLMHDHFTQAEFPVLGIKQIWETEYEQQLVDDYIQWLSPLLLTLSSLDQETRAKLEIAAQHRPLVVEKIHHLYPKIVDHSLLNKILVEAAMRKSQAKQTGDKK